MTDLPPEPFAPSGLDEAESSAPEGLGERDRRMLEFERRWWKYAGAKEQAIREQFDMPSTRYYQLLNVLIDRPEALEHDPVSVKRLRRMRTERRRRRAAHRPAARSEGGGD